MLLDKYKDLRVRTWVQYKPDMTISVELVDIILSSKLHSAGISADFLSQKLNSFSLTSSSAGQLTRRCSRSPGTLSQVLASQ